MTRTHRPKGAMCSTCTHSQRSCEHLPFETMRVVGRDADGTKVVLCTDHLRRPEEAAPVEWPIRGVRVDGDTVVITVKGGNDAARWLCGELVAMIYMPRPPVTVSPRGCHECAWGKVAGCWRCGGRS